MGAYTGIWCGLWAVRGCIWNLPSACMRQGAVTVPTAEQYNSDHGRMRSVECSCEFFSASWFCPCNVDLRGFRCGRRFRRVPPFIEIVYCKSFVRRWSPSATVMHTADVHRAQPAPRSTIYLLYSRQPTTWPDVVRLREMTPAFIACRQDPGDTLPWQTEWNGLTNRLQCAAHLTDRQCSFRSVPRDRSETRFRFLGSTP